MRSSVIFTQWNWVVTKTESTEMGIKHLVKNDWFCERVDYFTERRVTRERGSR